MENNIIAFLDSGIGGMSIMKYFSENLSGFTFIYYGDNHNAPYGNKNIYSLKTRAFEIVKCLLQYNPKAIVVACNTLSTNILSFIRDISPVPVIPVVPPIEKALFKYGGAILLSTQLTAKKYNKQYIDEIKSGRLCVYALENLATDIEKRQLSLESIRIREHFSIKDLQDLGVKSKKYPIILGCTHYFFIKKQIIGHFYPHKIIEEGEICFNEFLKVIKVRIKGEKTSNNQVIFAGENAIENSIFWEKVVKYIDNYYK